MEVAPSLSAFEVKEVGDAAAAAAAAAAAEAATGEDGSSSCSVWLAGHVEAFNIPGTNSQVARVRFLPSCYQWQLHQAFALL